MFLLEQGGGMAWVLLASGIVTWISAVIRIVHSDKDFHLAAAGGWFFLGGLVVLTCAQATLVPVHASVPKVLYLGLAAPLVGLMCMLLLLPLEAIAGQLNKIPRLPSRAIHWPAAAMLMGGLGLIMEIRLSLAIHAGLSPMVDLSPAEAFQQMLATTQMWFFVAGVGGIMSSILGFVLLIHGVWNGLHQ